MGEGPSKSTQHRRQESVGYVFVLEVKHALGEGPSKSTQHRRQENKDESQDAEVYLSHGRQGDASWVIVLGGAVRFRLGCRARVIGLGLWG